jgi:hypothetical protein
MRSSITRKLLVLVPVLSNANLHRRWECNVKPRSSPASKRNLEASNLNLPDTKSKRRTIGIWPHSKRISAVMKSLRLHQNSCTWEIQDLSASNFPHMGDPTGSFYQHIIPNVREISQGLSSFSIRDLRDPTGSASTRLPKLERSGRIPQHATSITWRTQ